jgi:L-iditol 2-dehydrogenase
MKRDFIMKALVLEKYNHFVYRDFENPKISDNEVLIKVRAAAICGSDVHGMDGSTGRRIPPVIMGHEASGEIVETGSLVQGYCVGDRVTFDSTVYCGKCSYCKQGKINLCDNRRVLGVSCEDYRIQGAFAEYLAVPEHILYRIPDGVSYEKAAMVEPLSIALHAVNMTDIKVNDTAVVVGAGMIGLLIIQVLAISGCSKVIALDLDQGKLDMAAGFGAETIDAKSPDVPEKVKKHNHGRGADIAFEAVGITPTIQTAISALKKGGHLILVGNVSPEIALPLQKIVTGEISLQGSCASSGEYDTCLDLIVSGKIDVEAFISAVAPLSEGDMWFHKLHEGKSNLMKVILKP